MICIREVVNLSRPELRRAFIERKKEVEKIESTTLPIGVVQNIELDREERNLESGRLCDHGDRWRDGCPA